MTGDPARIIRVFDIETSGLPEDEHHAICEMGWVDLDLATMTIGTPTAFLVNPGHPIPPYIRAIHHISDRDVESATTPGHAVELLTKDLGPDDILAAHSAAFEQAFVAYAGRWLCTWKISLRAWPDFKSHSNQALRYELDVDSEADFDPALAMPPHRAAPDAYVTAHILRKELQMGRPLARLVEISGEPGFLKMIGGQKHKGKTFKEVAATDPGYLQWIVDKSEMDEAHKFTAAWHLQRSVARNG